MTNDSYHMPICIGVVSESVSVKFSALYLLSKVSEKNGIDPPLITITKTVYVHPNLAFPLNALVHICHTHL